MPTMDRRRSHSAKRVSRKDNKRGYREFKRNAWSPHLRFGAQGQALRIDGPPQNMMQKLRYVGVGSLVSAAIAGNESGVTYNLDPFDIVGTLAPTAHQPTGFDQWSTIYSTWRVRAYKLRITAQALPSVASNFNSCTFASTIIPPGSATALSGYVDVAQDARSKSGVCQSYYSGITTHKHYYSLQSLAGNVDPLDDVYTGTNAAAAGQYPKLLMFIRNGSQPQGLSVLYQVEIKFYMEFFSPTANSKST